MRVKQDHWVRSRGSRGVLSGDCRWTPCSGPKIRSARSPRQSGALTASLRIRRASSSIDTPCSAARIRQRDSVSSSSLLTLKLAMVDSSCSSLPQCQTGQHCWRTLAARAFRQALRAPKRRSNSVRIKLQVGFPCNPVRPTFTTSEDADAATIRARHAAKYVIATKDVSPTIAPVFRITCFSSASTASAPYLAAVPPTHKSSCRQPPCTWTKLIRCQTPIEGNRTSRRRAKLDGVSVFGMAVGPLPGCRTRPRGLISRRVDR